MSKKDEFIHAISFRTNKGELTQKSLESTILNYVLCLKLLHNFSLPLQSPGTTYSGSSIFSSNAPVKTGPIISDITDLSQSGPASAEEWIEDRQVLI